MSVEKRYLVLAWVSTLCMIAAMFYTMDRSWGQDLEHHHGHPPQDQAIHEEFYSTWMMPDNRAVSCCHKMDCAPAEAKQINGQWFARKIEGEMDFTPIPSQKVETERDSPDGRSHLCGREYEQKLTVFCFIPGAGG